MPSAPDPARPRRTGRMHFVRRTMARARGDRPKAVVVYTVVTGGYDPLRVPGSVTPGYDYVAFLDQGTPGVSGPWQRRPVTVMERSPDVAARYYKLHPHLLFPDHDASVYID